MIKNYDKVLHFIDLNTYDETIHIISENIKSLKDTTYEDKRLLDSINKNLILVKAKVSSLRVHPKQKRGLINVLGSGLKFIAGSMDSDDEKEIRDAIANLREDERNTNATLNELVHINSVMTEEIGNITTHINRQQALISGYLNKFKDESLNRLRTLEDEVEFIEQSYRIDNDISLLRNHIDAIGQTIFSCRVGIIPSDILTEKEISLVSDYDSYSRMKIAVMAKANTIVLTLLIPQFSSKKLSRVTFVPIPNTANKSLVLDTYDILVDSNNNIFSQDIKDNLEKIL